ncbi:MAG: hypothetical protein Q4C49_13200 [Bacillota bacterium]|nr:hypothetical protein [Bacillota bacterium]
MRLPKQKFSNEKIGYEILQFISYLDEGKETTILQCLYSLYDLEEDAQRNYYSKKRDFTLLKDSCIEICGYVFSKAAKMNLVLDNSKYWGKNTGLPEKIPFVVHHASKEMIRQYEIKKMEFEI